MKKFLVLLFASVALCYEGVPFTDCGSEFSIDKVVIEDCIGLNEDEVCHLQIGKNVSVVITFDKYLEVNSMKSSAFINMFGQDFKLPVSPNSCDHMKCPVTLKDNVNTFRANVTLNSRIPGPAIFRLMSTHKRNKSVFCLTTKVNLF
ncbi:unnamed protein product [Brassicogethes aeneus]|uniref:MD-2-related lipid-recognition domain-containing protein n=1 Tax=Brassicogethes aeneus TaxID=1431903 RepID=A0A9P0AXL4_BRAAE|nr:unnamed protein product [Brassicogethes aeneus]